MDSRTKYPFRSMSIGESVVIAATDPNTVRASAHQFTRSNEGYRFSIKKCHGGTLLTRVAPLVETDGPSYSSYVCSVDRSVIYYGPGSHGQASAALAVMRSKGVELVDPIIVRAPHGTYEAGYLNDWIAPALEGVS